MQPSEQKQSKWNKFMHHPFLAGFLGMTFQFGCNRTPASSQPSISPPETNRLAFVLPSPAEIQRSIKGEFKGTAPSTPEEMEVYEELLQVAAFHPLKDWKFEEKAREYNGYSHAAWGGREYTLLHRGKLYWISEEVEPGYDGRMVAATCAHVLYNATINSQGMKGDHKLYVNDDWCALPFKILEERFDIDKRRLSGRVPFIESEMRPDAWSMPVLHVPKPPQPAPLALQTLAELPEDFGHGWKDPAPQGKVQRFIYLQALNMSAIYPIGDWTFEESLAPDFGKRDAVWGYRSYKTEVAFPVTSFKGENRVDLRAVQILEEVRHNGRHLEAHCTLKIMDRYQDKSTTVALQLSGGWAELPYRYLETRYFLQNGLLPKRVPFITTPTTPGSYVE